MMPGTRNTNDCPRFTDPTLERPIVRVSNGARSEVTDALAVEAPLEIQVSWQCRSRVRTEAVTVTMRTPGSDRELALGFLFAEGIISASGDVSRVETDPAEPNRICVTLNPGKRPALWEERSFLSNSSCGVCGKASLESLGLESVPRVAGDDMRVRFESLGAMARMALERQTLFRQTGGIHASALFAPGGELIAVREDVGRHNALDKLTGYLHLGGAVPAAESVLILSGRIGYELVQKAAVAGIPVVVAVGAASSLAVGVAERAGITLGGFLRGESLNIYTHPERIVTV